MISRIQVLLIEDDPDSTLLISRYLNETAGPSLTFVMECADRLQAGLELLALREFDVVLLDLQLPDSRGLDTLGRVRSLVPETPVVVLTNADSEALGLDAVAGGAQDFLVKEKCDARALKRAVGYALERQRHWSQLESILDNSPEGMIVVDERGAVLYVNPAAEILLGGKAADMRGKPFGFPLEARKTSELRLPRKDGGEAIVEMRVTGIQWGRHRARLASIHDISELIRVERLRAEINERLQASRAQEEFLLMISHELRAPLSAVRAAIDTLRDHVAGPLPEPYEQAVRAAERNVSRQVRIIGNFLNLSRLESGRAEIKRRPVDVIALIQEAVAEFGPSRRRENISLTLNLPPSLPSAWADPDLLAQVVINLLDNALRYARREVVLRARPEGTDLIWVGVSDDGPGIPPDQAGKLFEKFVQLDRRGDGGYRGTGLGLAICREILKANKGRIWVESRESGAQFQFTLPRSAESSAPEAAARRADAGP